MVAVVLFPLGAAYSVFESIGKLQSPQPIESSGWAIGTILMAMLFESLSLRVAIREAREASGQESLWEYIRRTRNPDIASVLLEDAGAVLGLGIALAGIGIAVVINDSRFDAYGGLAISALLLLIAWVLAAEVKSLIIGESATSRELSIIRKAISEEPRMRRIINLRTLHLSPNELLVAAKVELDRNLGYEQVAETIDAIEERVYERLPEVQVLHIEPDMYAPHERPRPLWDRGEER